MYQKKSHGWYKHKDFILLDLLCIFLAFIFAYYIRNHTYISITDNGVYRNAMIFVLFADLVVIILFEIYTGVLRLLPWIHSGIRTGYTDRAGSRTLFIYCRWRENLFKSSIISYRCCLRSFILHSQDLLEKTSYSNDGRERRTFSLYHHFLRYCRICGGVSSPAQL